MAWDFETEPEFQARLDWADRFEREEVEPLDKLWGDLIYHQLDGRLRKIVNPLKEEARRQKRWATQLGPELGGEGCGQLKLSLLNEILGRSRWAPIVFVCQAPDTGNAEIIARYGTPEQKERYPRPLFDGEIFSCYSMTEPHPGATRRCSRPGPSRTATSGSSTDGSSSRPTRRRRLPHRDGGHQHERQPLQRHLDVPRADRGTRHQHRPRPRHRRRVARGLPRADPLRGCPRTRGGLLGEEGQAFVVAQTRLAGGRIHHAVRTSGRAQKTLDMMCERALSRENAGQPPGDYRPSEDLWPTEHLRRRWRRPKAKFAEYLEHEVGNL